MIRRATAADLGNAGLLTLGRTFFLEAGLPGEFIPTVFQRNWTIFMAADYGAMWLLEADGKVIGAIAGLIHPDPYDDVLVAQEMFWFIHPDKRHSIGAMKLYTELQSWAVERGAKRFVMACVCNHYMGKLRKLYERLGFRPVDVSYFKNI